MPESDSSSPAPEEHDTPARPEATSPLAGAILDALAEGLIVCDMDGHVLDMNPAALRLYGYGSVAEVRRHRHAFPDTFQLHDAQGRPVPADEWPFARALRGETFTNYQVRVRRRETGVDWWGSYNGSVVHDAAGAPLRVVITVQDVSALKRAEREMQYVTSHARCLLWFGTVTRYEDDWLTWNARVFDEAAAQAFCPLDVRSGESYTDAWYRHRLPADQELTSAAAARAFETGASHYGAEFGCRGSDGVVRWFSEQVNIEPLRVDPQPPDPRVNGRWRVVGVCTDVSERRQAEQALREAALRQRQFLRDVLASVTDGKLRLCDTPDDLPVSLPPVVGPISLSPPDGLRALRQSVREAATALGFIEERWQDLVTAVGEASMNAVVHAGGGWGRVGTDGRDTVQVWVTDQGTGIAVEDLPHAALQKGFTTAGSLGHGMKMMLQTADRVWLLTGPAGTTVVLSQDRLAPAFPW